MWFSVPSKIRKPITLTIGLLFVITSGLTGWLPGPGGIPLFLIGIAILASEFQWAERIKVQILAIVHYLGALLRKYPRTGYSLIIGLALTSLSLGYWFFWLRG